MTYPFDEWFRKRRLGSWFPDIDTMMREMEKMMGEAFQHFEQPVPKKFIKERKLDDGSTIKEYGPVVYGYSVKIGEDGKPIIRKFGNIDAFSHTLASDSTEIQDEREPLIDVIMGKEEIKVVAEMPGVEKEDLRLNANENTLTISCSTSSKQRYHKKIDFPEPVEPTTGRSQYRNGVLEITFKKKNIISSGVQINIE